MTRQEHVLWQALVELETTVQSMRTASSKPDFRPQFARVDELARELPANAPPELLHYLHKKSYAKARLWLEGRDGENARGACRS